MGLRHYAGLPLHVFTAGPASSSADALRLLASWAGTQQQAAAPETQRDPDPT